VTILVAILFLAMTACAGQSGPPSPAPLPKPAVYPWIGPGPSPSVQRLAQDKTTCFQETEQRESRSMSDRWHAHLKRCMEMKGWGEKAID
jgi:hypothetical protein